MKITSVTYIADLPVGQVGCWHEGGGAVAFVIKERIEVISGIARNCDNTIDVVAACGLLEKNSVLPVVTILRVGHRHYEFWWDWWNEYKDELKELSQQNKLFIYMVEENNCLQKSICIHNVLATNLQKYVIDLEKSDPWSSESFIQATEDICEDNVSLWLTLDQPKQIIKPDITVIKDCGGGFSLELTKISESGKFIVVIKKDGAALAGAWACLQTSIDYDSLAEIVYHWENLLLFRGVAENVFSPGLAVTYKEFIDAIHG